LGIGRERRDAAIGAEAGGRCVRKVRGLVSPLRGSRGRGRVIPGAHAARLLTDAPPGLGAGRKAGGCVRGSVKAD
jgi:hypothetical protein